MKLDEQKAAQMLYFQTDMSKSEIADQLGISRVTLNSWIQLNNWESLKRTAANIPSFLAENCYHILADLQRNIMSVERKGNPATPQEINSMRTLTFTIAKLKTRSTVNETMEIFARLTDIMNAKDPALAKKMQPHLDEYIITEASKNPKHQEPGEPNQFGYVPKTNGATQYHEAKLDTEDLIRWSEEEKAKTASPAPAPATTPVATPPTPATNTNPPAPAVVAATQAAQTQPSATPQQTNSHVPNATTAKLVADVLKPKKTFTQTFKEQLRDARKAKDKKHPTAA